MAKEHLNVNKGIAHFLGTILISTLIAVLINVLTSFQNTAAITVISYTIGLSIFLFAASLSIIFQPKQPLHLALTYVFALCGGVSVGILLPPFLLRHLFSIDLFWPMHSLEVIIVAVIVSGVATYVFYMIHRMHTVQEKIEEEKMGRLLLERQSLEMNLRLLQAQIEPHFLFNTLSNVVSLIDTDPARGKAMLLDLTSYLRTSLSRTRPEKTTLAQETDMVRAYLNIQKVRMGERLHFTIDVPEPLQETPFPPMLLQPLVENAVKHGLEPKIDGGEIAIRAALKDGALQVEVADTGMGLSPVEEGGVGIANVRERLRLLFEDRGRLILEENQPSGVRAVIEVPAHG